MALSLELKQKQALSQRMLQTLNILQMSTQELEAYIQNASLENPVIELQTPHEDSAFSYESDNSKDVYKHTDIMRKLDWLESTDLQNKVYYDEDRDSNTFEAYTASDITEETLADYLKAQLMLKDYSKFEQAILEYILNSLDDRGYLTDSAASIATYFSVPVRIVETLIKDVKALDPAGVGAKDLSECLKIQLLRMHNTDALALAIVEDYLEDIAKNHIDVIARKLKKTTDEVLDACDIIKTLNPKPGSHFSSREQLKYISPDIYVVKTESNFEILINEYRFPAINISVEYKNLLAESKDADVKDYLKAKINEAENLKSNIHMRSETLSKVARELVAWQKDFFLHGPGNIKPMRLKDLAMKIDVHESTVSRALNGKYLQCIWGVFPLNYFLASPAISVSKVSASNASAANSYSNNSDASEAGTPSDISGDAAKALLKKIIEEEDKKKPLSDQKISEKMAEAGIDISRRTVNKYRGIMGIPDKSGRKVLR
ncbi:MAG: RNA polymerase factor sigma-54 [Lachnospiraceae bacterium]|nr:RNA polymerase factor sigma-54 [Lachnospiraceae bacterium]